MTIGIPQALIYWKRPHFWETFFKELNFKVLLSPPTNKEIVEKGVKVSDPETCFAEKVFFGHILWLDEKCDWIFIPRLKTNAEKLEYCPKFFGVPDLAKILVKSPILTENFDEKKEKFKKTLGRLGKKINKGQREIEKAAKKAFLKEKELKEREKEDFLKEMERKEKKIVLVSHPYNLYDDYVNLGVKEKLKKLGVHPIFIEEVPVEKSRDQKSKIQDLGYPKFHWEFGKEIMEKVDRILDLDYGIVGAIEISSFQCGCDAVLKEFVEKKFKENKIPFLYLLIDEQTGEAGIQTRLEAFMDTLK
jgi:predicted nucleotide-binding protein (sugar kinase/HSP70/actin superfamily)